MHLKLLGGFELYATDGSTLRISSRKNQLLLAYLCVTVGTKHTRDYLADLFWSDRQYDQARSSLRTALSSIRQIVGSDALEADRDAVCLQTGHVATDAQDLSSILADPSPDLTLSRFYDGEFLAGHEHDGEQFSSWLRATRAEYQNTALRILALLAERLIQTDRREDAIERLRESLSLEPLHEDTHRKMMCLYADIGNRAMALSQFRSCKELLKHELDVEPSPETQKLADTIAMGADRNFPTADERKKAAHSASVSSPSGTRRPTKETPFLVVLPFVNMSGDAEQSYFAEGIYEDVLTDLATVTNLSVAAKSSGSMFRGETFTPRQIADELGVQFILEGSVRKAGERVRISVQLTDATLGTQTWAQRFDRELKDIFAVQEEIAGSIVTALQKGLSSVLENVPTGRSRTDAETYDLHLRARSLLRDMSRQNIEAAQGLFTEVVQRDPGFAPGYAGLADCATVLIQHYDVSADLLDQALADCDRALRIDPALPEAHAAKGYILTHRTDTEAARQSLLMAVELGPKSADTHYYLGKFFLGVDEQPEKAIEAAERAFSFEPDLRAGMLLATSLKKAGKTEEVKRLGLQILDIARRRVALDPYDQNATLHHATALGNMGKTEEGRRWARRAVAFDSADGAFVYNLACALSELDLADEALKQVRKTLELGCSKIKVHFMSKTDPDLDLIRDDPRFKEMISEYWSKRMTARRATRGQ